MDKDMINNQVDDEKMNLPTQQGGFSNMFGAINTSQIVTGSGSIALDLVVIIDTSGSMSDESNDLSQ